MYGKVFSSLFTGSMRGHPTLQLVFVYMITNATKEGVCDFMPQCIADATGMKVEQINKAITVLEGEDVMSRTVRDNGRRIVKLDDNRPWGWQIVNYDMYRSIASKQDMREAERLRKQQYRAKNKGTGTVCPKVSRTKPGLSASASVDGNTGKGKGKVPHGEFGNVTLSKEDYEKLLTAHGQADLDAGIEILDNYIESKGVSYRSCYATMKKNSWVWDRVKEERAKEEDTGKGLLET
jgi:hypothetical protein